MLSCQPAFGCFENARRNSPENLLYRLSGRGRTDGVRSGWKEAVIKAFHAALVLALLVPVLGASESAFAAGRSAGGRHQHHGHGRAIVTVPVFSPWYYPWPPYYYFPPEPEAPTVYIEQSSEPKESAQQPAYWYYCPESKGYYPDVKECPGGWQQLVSESPPS